MTTVDAPSGAGTTQFIRYIQLLVGKPGVSPDGNFGGQGKDLSQLRIWFSIEHTSYKEPNRLYLKIYNLEQETMNQIEKEYTRIILKAGYNGNAGVIFDGEVAYLRRGNMLDANDPITVTRGQPAYFENRESPTDTFFFIQAIDGHYAFQYASQNITLAAGATVRDMINSLKPALAPYGISILDENIPKDLPVFESPRGVTLRASVADILDQIKKIIGDGTEWTFENMQLHIVLKGSYIPARKLILNETSGLIGSVQQEMNAGVYFTCLLNPYIRLNTRVELKEKLIQQIPGPVGATAIEETRVVATNGIYRCYVVRHYGDTRNNEWYTSVSAIGVDQPFFSTKSDLA